MGVAQVVRQAVAPQTYALQLIVGCAQFPAPSQAPTRLGRRAGAARGAAAGAERALAAGRRRRRRCRRIRTAGWSPCSRRVDRCCRRRPAGKRRLPPATLQTWQVPQLAVEQQTPSTQLPLPHSAPAAQIWPRRLRPQAPALQTLPGDAVGVGGADRDAGGRRRCRRTARRTGSRRPCRRPRRRRCAPSVAVRRPVGQDGAAHWVPAA